MIIDYSVTEYVLHNPYVGDDGIYVPSEHYVPKGFAPVYKLLMSKEVFVEAYNKWIKGEDGNARD